MPNSLKCKIKHLRHNGTLTERECDRILKALEQQPTRPTGKWMFTVDGNTDHITCSVCGRDSMGTFDYCPNCGAKMEGMA